MAIKTISVLGYSIVEDGKEQLFAATGNDRFYCTGKINPTDTFNSHTFKECANIPCHAEFIGHYNLTINE